MSLYEWMLFVEKKQKEVKTEVEKQVFFFETTWKQTRTLWETMINRTGGDGGRAVSGTDLIKFKSDEEAERAELMKPMTFSLKDLKTKYGSRIKINNGVN